MSRGTLREMLAEFFGTFVLILFGAGVVAQFIISKQAQRQLPRDQPRVGPRRRDGLLRVDGRVRRAPEPRRHAGRGGAPRVPVEEGRAVRDRPDRRGLCRGGRCLPDLSRGADGLRRRRAAGAGAAGHGRHLRDVPAAVPEHVPGRVHRSGGGHGDSRRGDSRDHGPAQRARRRPGSRRSSSASSWWASARRSAPTPATPSTRPATSGRACSPIWPGGGARSSAPATTGGGSRLWARSWAACSAAGSTTCLSGSGFRGREPGVSRPRAP